MRRHSPCSKLKEKQRHCLRRPHEDHFWDFSYSCITGKKEGGVFGRPSIECVQCVVGISIVKSTFFLSFLFIIGLFFLTTIFSRRTVKFWKGPKNKIKLDNTAKKNRVKRLNGSTSSTDSNNVVVVVIVAVYECYLHNERRGGLDGTTNTVQV